MAALHLSMQEHHIFSQVDPDHPLFLLLADIAAENNIPIDLHMEAVPQDAPTPESLLRASSHNPATLRANIGGLERLLEHNQNAKIVWQHIGWDNIGYMTTDLLRYLLNKHPNLYVAIRVERRMLKVDQSGPMTNRIVDNNWNVRPEWRKFIIDFSDRIVVGSDDFMGMARQQPRPKDSFIETWGIMRQFPEEIARKIGRNNAARIYLYR
jgi:predicted TIM-barrel fold metal-dependent hydrolase